MFNNIGVKIKNVARFVAIFSIIVGVIGIILAFFAIYYEEDVGFPILLISIVATIVPVISAYPLYAFGQLIDNTDKMVALLERLDKRMSTSKQDVQTAEKAVSVEPVIEKTSIIAPAETPADTETATASSIKNVTDTPGTLNMPSTTGVQKPVSAARPTRSVSTVNNIRQTTIMRTPTDTTRIPKEHICPNCGIKGKVLLDKGWVICPQCRMRLD